MFYIGFLLAITCGSVSLTIYNETNYHRNWNMLPITNCGKGKLSNRIVGGDFAALGQFPWICRLAYASFSGRKIEFSCAGSLISKIHVLTAAHCVTSRLRRKLRFIRLGENFANVDVDCDDDGTCAPLPQDIGVKDIIIHKKFNFITFENDIALISLENRARFNEYVFPICLPRSTLLDEKFTLTGYIQVAGWGETNSWNSYYPTRLKYVRLPIQNVEECNRISKTPLDSSRYCVGEGKGKDSCDGDSGGPMMKAVALNAPPKYFLFGVVSQGPAVCGEEPAIYTSVTYYMKWILDLLDYVE